MVNRAHAGFCVCESIVRPALDCGIKAHRDQARMDARPFEAIERVANYNISERQAEQMLTGQEA